jgi:putative hydrolase of the HAD superfamily
MKEIKNIIFDLGGVLLPIDYDATPRAFWELGVPDFQTFYAQNRQNELFDAYETGKISEDDFFSELRSFVGTYSNAELLKCWNAMLGELPDAIPKLLQNCRNHYSIYLLSNTNHSHIEAFQLSLKGKFTETTFNDFFEKAYYSYRIGLRKPDTEVFDYVIQDAGLLPDETLFIEDTLKNVEGARQAGIPTLYLDIKNGMRTLDLFDDSGRLKQGCLEIIK